MKKIILIITGALIIIALGAYLYMQFEDKKMTEMINNMKAPKEQVENDTATTSKINLNVNVEIKQNSYTMNDVSQHASRDNCWLIIENKVYNVTAFVDQHPGGNRILNGCGHDATEMFNKVRLHAKQSVQALKIKFYIGELK